MPMAGCCVWGGRRYMKDVNMRVCLSFSLTHVRSLSPPVSLPLSFSLLSVRVFGLGFRLFVPLARSCARARSLSLSLFLSICVVPSFSLSIQARVCARAGGLFY